MIVVVKCPIFCVCVHVCVCVCVSLRVCTCVAVSCEQLLMVAYNAPPPER